MFILVNAVVVIFSREKYALLFQKCVFKKFSDIAGNVTHRVLLTQVSITLDIQYRGLQSINLVYFNSPGISVLQDFWKDG